MANTMSGLPEHINGVKMPMDLHAPTLRWVVAFLESLPQRPHQQPKGAGAACHRPHDLEDAARQVGYVADFIEKNGQVLERTGPPDDH